MRWFITAAILLIVAGAACVLYSQSIPVYSDADAPSRISSELASLPRETRFKEWYSRLLAFETPHKRFSDVGRGLCAAGVALLASLGLWRLYHRSARARTVAAVLTIWSALWLGRIPFTMWYYIVRQQRFDYPAWGDSIAIALFSESIAWFVGAVLSSLILRLLLIRHPLPAAIRLVRPSSAYGWVRAVFIGCWLAALALCVFEGVSDGDEGVVLASTIASVILLAFLSASELSRPNEPTNEAVQPAANGA